MPTTENGVPAAIASACSVVTSVAPSFANSVLSGPATSLVVPRARDDHQVAVGLLAVGVDHLQEAG